MTTDQVMDVTTRSGGVFQSAVDESTNCIVLGAEADQGAAELAQVGRTVEVLSETQFLGMIGLE